MTEPDVAGSDPTMINTTAVLDGDEYVINGHKWFASQRLGRRLHHRDGRDQPRRTRRTRAAR